MFDLTPCVPLSWEERGRRGFEGGSPFKLPLMGDRGGKQWQKEKIKAVIIKVKGG